jgi:hypothetical protein
MRHRHSRQQPIPAAEHRPAIGGIIAGRHGGRIPGLVNQVNHALQQGVERCAGEAVQLDESPVLEPDL